MLWIRKRQFGYYKECVVDRGFYLVYIGNNEKKAFLLRRLWLCVGIHCLRIQDNIVNIKMVVKYEDTFILSNRHELSPLNAGSQKVIDNSLLFCIKCTCYLLQYIWHQLCDIKQIKNAFVLLEISRFRSSI